MESYINEKLQVLSMKRLLILFILILSLTGSVFADTNSTSLGENHVDTDHALFIDFSSDATTYIFIILFVILILSFIFIIHPINSLLLLFSSIILIANGFNMLIGFFILLISIILLSLSNK